MPPSASPYTSTPARAMLRAADSAPKVPPRRTIGGHPASGQRAGLARCRLTFLGAPITAPPSAARTRPVHRSRWANTRRRFGGLGRRQCGDREPRDHQPLRRRAEELARLPSGARWRTRGCRALGPLAPVDGCAPCLARWSWSPSRHPPLGHRCRAVDAEASLRRPVEARWTRSDTRTDRIQRELVRAGDRRRPRDSVSARGARPS